MMINTSVTSALVGLVVIVVIVGLMMGLAFAGTEVFNPQTSAARANEIERETSYQAQRDDIELEHYRQEMENEAEIRDAEWRQNVEFERRRQEQELAYQRERNERRLALLPIREGVLLVVCSLVLLTVGSALVFYLFSLGRAARQARPDPWQSPEWREGIRRMAQTNEQLQHHLELFQKQVGEAVIAGGNGRQKERTWN